MERKPPKNIKFETFLGMITQVSIFIPIVSSKTSILRDLLRKKSLQSWNAIHDIAFIELKHILSKKQVLKYFEENCYMTLSVDVSQFGLRTVILQIYCLSRIFQKILLKLRKIMRKLKTKHQLQYTDKKNLISICTEDYLQQKMTMKTCLKLFSKNL